MFLVPLHDFNFKFDGISIKNISVYSKYFYFSFLTRIRALSSCKMVQDPSREIFPVF